MKYITIGYYLPDVDESFDPSVTNITRITRGPPETFEADPEPHIELPEQRFDYQSTHRVTAGILTPLT